MKGQLENTKQAIRKLGETLGKHGQQVTHAIPYNNHRHYLLETHEGGRYWTIFKRHPFMTYEWKFDVVRGTGGKGAGETMNEIWLDKAIALNAQYIVFIYPNGKSYGIKPSEFKRIGERRTTQIYGEETISIPMRLLQPMQKILKEEKQCPP